MIELLNTLFNNIVSNLHAVSLILVILSIETIKQKFKSVKDEKAFLLTVIFASIPIIMFYNGLTFEEFAYKYFQLMISVQGVYSLIKNTQRIIRPFKQKIGL